MRVLWPLRAAAVWVHMPGVHRCMHACVRRGIGITAAFWQGPLVLHGLHGGAFMGSLACCLDRVPNHRLPLLKRLIACAAACAPPRPACRCLSLDSILTLLTALLLEQQVVLFCPNLSILSALVLATMPLLRPFRWQSLLMPVLPTSMLGFLDAPVPFLLGVQYKTSEIMSRCAGHIRVNVYKARCAPRRAGMKHR